MANGVDALRDYRSQYGGAGQGQPQAPLPQLPGLSQAYGAPLPGAATNQQMNPFLLNQMLEAQVRSQGGNRPLNPIIQQIMQHLGLLNFIRNRGNAAMMDPEAQSGLSQAYNQPMQPALQQAPGIAPTQGY